MTTAVYDMALNMPTHAPQASPALAPPRGQVDPVLAAIRRAPVVPFTDAERALIAEVEGDRSTWQTTEQLMAKLARHPGAAAGDEDDHE